jgi:hypothetical protein
MILAKQFNLDGLGRLDGSGEFGTIGRRSRPLQNFMNRILDPRIIPRTGNMVGLNARFLVVSYGQ